MRTAAGHHYSISQCQRSSEDQARGDEKPSTKLNSDHGEHVFGKPFVAGRLPDTCSLITIVGTVGNRVRFDGEPVTEVEDYTPEHRHITTGHG